MGLNDWSMNGVWILDMGHNKWNMGFDDCSIGFDDSGMGSSPSRSSSRRAISPDGRHAELYTQVHHPHASTHFHKHTGLRVPGAPHGQLRHAPIGPVYVQGL